MEISARGLDKEVVKRTKEDEQKRRRVETRRDETMDGGMDGPLLRGGVVRSVSRGGYRPWTFYGPSPIVGGYEPLATGTGP